MTDIVYLYPKSSCPTENCRKKYPETQGYKSNLSVNGCKVSDYFDCYDKLEVSSSIQPKTYSNFNSSNKEAKINSNFNSNIFTEEKINPYEINEINPQAYTEKIAQGFNKVGCKTDCKDAPYISLDPRLFNSPRADYLPLDRPPMDSSMRLADIYTDKLDSYGIGFKPYDQINDGQIVYYIDTSIKDAFYKPVYTEKARETLVLYKDPMGAMKPEHNRTALENMYNHSVVQSECYPDTLSFIQDSQTFREDIIALQQRKNNQEKWSARWY